ncbi:MAG TPA: sarcosine oxidase subunit gamma family protein [Phenylobacterium sp.]|uniref:sarcosine oxidase subunit gamma n=1 Tax=Phenylobacterium sp. TaxID=1871053 RepID=UPI002B489CD1|nr:sarcosine oxidase subunit gamma family protein [Phenylobacterium sp.]HKR89182.1 sarcosine oxidase subunit gamma family protein [Phenylobacterium sp.]
MPEAIQIEERTGFGLATVMARKGVAAEAVARALGVPPPVGAGWTSTGDLALIATGPGTWLALSAGGLETHAARLLEALGPMASVVDQSGGYVIHKLSGPGARTVLQRGAAIDLHPQAFGPRSAAVTVISHIGVVLRQLDETPAYEVAVFRSYAASFRRWLDAAIAAL